MDRGSRTIIQLILLSFVFYILLGSRIMAHSNVMSFVLYVLLHVLTYPVRPVTMGARP